MGIWVEVVLQNSPTQIHRSQSHIAGPIIITANWCVGRRRSSRWREEWRFAVTDLLKIVVVLRARSPRWDQVTFFFLWTLHIYCPLIVFRIRIMRAKLFLIHTIASEVEDRIVFVCFTARVSCVNMTYKLSMNVLHTYLLSRNLRVCEI